MAHTLVEHIPASTLAQSLGLELRGRNEIVASVGSLSEAGKGVLVFSSSPSPEVVPGAIVVAGSDSFTLDDALDFTLIISKTPRLDFMRALETLSRSPGFERNLSPPDIHPTAIIGQNVVIEPGCVVAENVVIEHNVVIHSGTLIGAGSRIRANASIGGDGFGFERGSDGRPVKFIHLGGVVIGRDVEIGSNTCVARGTLGFTRIDDHAKIDNLVHIAHNCHIESGAFVIACAEVSGGVRVGRNAWLGPNSSIIQKVTVGDGALVGLGAVVVKDVMQNSVCVGNPAKFLRTIESTK